MLIYSLKIADFCFPAYTYPSVSIVFFYKFSIIIIVKGWISIHSFLLTQVMVLFFGTIHCSISNLEREIIIIIKKTGSVKWSSDALNPEWLYKKKI